MVKVSVIVPCYNQGHFLDEAVGSVLGQTFSDVEIIIINDGSTDSLTKTILQTASWPNTKVIHTDNQGLAAARNNGIDQAEGQYILPLDADDVIEPEYIEKAAELLDQNPDLGIVYSRARLFGAVTTEWTLPPYSLEAILQDNVIFCSAMFRRQDWEAVGGYDQGMVFGWEDYEFWISLIERGRKVCQIPEVLFGYRVATDSMVRSKEKWQKIAMFKRVYQRHQQLFSDNIEVWLKTILDAREPYYLSRLYVDCGAGISDETSIIHKVEPGTTVIRFDLNGFDNIKTLRFDPVDVPVVVQVFQFVLEYEDENSKEFLDYEDNALLGDEKNNRYFDHNDPQFHLHLSEKELRKIRALTVKLSFKALEGAALTRLVNLQKGIIEEGARRSGLQALLWSLKRRPKEGLGAYLKRQISI